MESLPAVWFVKSLPNIVIESYPNIGVILELLANKGIERVQTIFRQVSTDRPHKAEGENRRQKRV